MITIAGGHMPYRDALLSVEATAWSSLYICRLSRPKSSLPSDSRYIHFGFHHGERASQIRRLGRVCPRLDQGQLQVVRVRAKDLVRGRHRVWVAP